MKTSIRSKRFTLGMMLFLALILILSISSAYYLNMLSGKTSAILKENHYSVVYARNMSEDLTIINQEINSSYLANRYPDTLLINKEFLSFNESLNREKNNITEVGEGELASEIETIYNDYHKSVLSYLIPANTTINILYLQKTIDTLFRKLNHLSQMNERAIEVKTDDAKVSANRSTLQMTLIGTICFLVAYGFTFTFSSYFNQRFYRLYNGIKESESSNYNQRIYFEGNDELSEISSVFNKMAEKINENKQKMSVTLQKDSEKDYNSGNIQELKNFLNRIKSIEEETREMISRFEKR